MIKLSRAGILHSGPTVSVVIPHYNYGQYLPMAVRSVLEQERVGIDLIIVDDASTDGSAAVARKLAARDDRVCLVEHSENAGHIATYNDGLARARGKYVVLLSADDCLAPGALARAVALLESDAKLGFVYGRVDRFAERLPPFNARRSSWTRWTGEEWLRIVCRRGRNLITNPEVVMRTSTFSEIGGYEPSMPHSADMYLWMRAAARAGVGRVNGPTQAFYRSHGQNMHSSQFGGLLDDYSAVLATFDRFFEVDGGLLERPADLHRFARRAIAREALNRSLHASGETADRDRLDLLLFAGEIGASYHARRLYEVTSDNSVGRALRAFDNLRWRVRYQRNVRFGI